MRAVENPELLNRARLVGEALARAVERLRGR
jgi:hypothetical protein